jgi:hypothetical protein
VGPLKIEGVHIKYTGTHGGAADMQNNTHLRFVVETQVNAGQTSPLVATCP